MVAGDMVLVLAGGSGVGQAAIQLARLAGARVFATAASHKTEPTERLGAEAVFDHYATDFAREIRAATGGHGADIVIEHVGESTWDRSVRALARGGRLVTCGATTGPSRQPRSSPPLCASAHVARLVYGRKAGTAGGGDALLRGPVASGGRSTFIR